MLLSVIGQHNDSTVQRIEQLGRGVKPRTATEHGLYPTSMSLRASKGPCTLALRTISQLLQCTLHWLTKHTHLGTQPSEVLKRSDVTGLISEFAHHLRTRSGTGRHDHLRSRSSLADMHWGVEQHSKARSTAQTLKEGCTPRTNTIIEAVAPVYGSCLWLLSARTCGCLCAAGYPCCRIELRGGLFSILSCFPAAQSDIRPLPAEHLCPTQPGWGAHRPVCGSPALQLSSVRGTCISHHSTQAQLRHQ